LKGGEDYERKYGKKPQKKSVEKKGISKKQQRRRSPLGEGLQKEPLLRGGGFDWGEERMNISRRLVKKESNTTGKKKSQDPKNHETNMWEEPQLRKPGRARMQNP